MTITPKMREDARISAEEAVAGLDQQERQALLIQRIALQRRRAHQATMYALEIEVLRRLILPDATQSEWDAFVKTHGGMGG